MDCMVCILGVASGCDGGSGGKNLGTELRRKELLAVAVVVACDKQGFWWGCEGSSGAKGKRSVINIDGVCSTKI